MPQLVGSLWPDSVGSRFLHLQGGPRSSCLSCPCSPLGLPQGLALRGVGEVELVPCFHHPGLVPSDGLLEHRFLWSQPLHGAWPLLGSPRLDLLSCSFLARSSFGLLKVFVLEYNVPIGVVQAMIPADRIFRHSDVFVLEGHVPLRVVQAMPCTSPPGLGRALTIYGFRALTIYGLRAKTTGPSGSSLSRSPLGRLGGGVAHYRPPRWLGEFPGDVELPPHPGTPILQGQVQPLVGLPGCASSQLQGLDEVFGPPRDYQV